jgi:hypothetical protein
MWKTVWRVVSRGLSEPVMCEGHHWHVTGRGWACCACPGRASGRRGRPAGPVGQAVRCKSPVEATAGLEKWLTQIAPPRVRFVTRRNSRDRELV